MKSKLSPTNYLKAEPLPVQATSIEEVPFVSSPSSDNSDEADSQTLCAVSSDEVWSPHDTVDSSGVRIPTFNRGHFPNANTIVDESEQGDWVRNPTDPSEMSRWAGQPSIWGQSEMVRMILLNFSTLGITFTWGVEMTYCTPYLLSLGLSKSKTSLVWIAGPLSGLIVQPIVGAIADRSKSKWGRRRPFIVVGAVIVAGCLIALGFTKELVGLLLGDSDTAKSMTIMVAVLAIYAVDFSINAVMSAARSLVVDTLPIHKQQHGAAWGSRMSAVGHLIGYTAGAIDLGLFFGDFLGDTQFKKLTIIAAISVLGSSLVTSWAVQERVLVDIKYESNQKRGLFKVVRQIWSTILHLPPRISAICWANFWAWIGWFPFLFYNTTWIGETYFRYDVPADSKASQDTLGDIGRVGSTALVIYSCVTLLGAALLPFLVKAPDDSENVHRPPARVAALVQKLGLYKPDLLTAWMIAHATFAGAMYLAPFAHSFRFATILVCICGLPWMVAMWAPTTFLGVEVNKLSGTSEGSYRRLSTDSMELTDVNGSTALNVEHEQDEDATSLGMEAEPSSTISKPSNSTGELSGIYFGILNIYTTLPQFVATFISTIVFAVLEPGKSPELAHDAHQDEHHSTDGPNAIAVCLFIGALSATYAIYATRKLRYL